MLSAEYSISIIHLRGIGVLLDAEFVDAAPAQLVHVSAPIFNPMYPAIQPGVAVLFCLGLLVILAEEGIVALVVSLDRRGVRAITTFHHRVDQETGDHGAVRV